MGNISGGEGIANDAQIVAVDNAESGPEEETKGDIEQLERELAAAEAKVEKQKSHLTAAEAEAAAAQERLAAAMG